MASANPEGDASMFMQRRDDRSSSERENSPRGTTDVKVPEVPPEVITVKDFFDFMKTAYQVYEHIEGSEYEGTRISWEELTKLTVLNHVIEQQERDLLYQTAYAEHKPISSKSDTTLEKRQADELLTRKRYSCSEIEGKHLGKHSTAPEARVEMLGIWTEASLNCKLNDVINEGILDSILPYLVGYKKPTRTTSVYTPIMKKVPSATEIKKPPSFGGFLEEKESKDRLGRRKSSIAATQERLQRQKHDGDVEIHVCDEVKGLKKDFKCSQKLLVSKMGYFADVTAGQRLEDMDISVHCDIQIFDWLMRWVKRDTILVADWPLLEPHNVIPILVSASFLQMEPLLHDCLTYCHAHMNDILKTSTDLACLSDALLSRLAAMYTNVELESIKDRKDKILSRLYCRMILSLAEPVPETLRGHYATLATLFKCSKCNKLLGRHIAEHVPCQPCNMRIDRRGNIVSTHTKDLTWSLNDYISWLYGELRSWRRVYWRLWADCHFLKCQLCDMHFPAYQLEWCCQHEATAVMFGGERGSVLPTGRYPCCGERAYRFETISRNTGCQFREHIPDEQSPQHSAVAAACARFRDIVAMRPPQLVFPERLTKLLTREASDESAGRLQCKEVFWWEGIQLLPPRQPLGLLGKLYTSNNKFNPCAKPGSPVPRASTPTVPSSGTPATETNNETKALAPAPPPPRDPSPKNKKGTGAGDDHDEGCDEQSSSSDESEQSSSGKSDEECPRRRHVPPAQPVTARNTRGGCARAAVGRQWLASLSARSNQDGQRRYEERAARLMRTALARRAAVAPPRQKIPSGGVYARLEAEWRERHRTEPPRARAPPAHRPRPPPTKYKA